MPTVAGQNQLRTQQAQDQPFRVAQVGRHLSISIRLVPTELHVTASLVPPLFDAACGVDRRRSETEIDLDRSSVDPFRSVIVPSAATGLVIPTHVEPPLHYSCIESRLDGKR